jgi:hypothetical protein
VYVNCTPQQIGSQAVPQIVLLFSATCGGLGYCACVHKHFTLFCCLTLWWEYWTQSVACARWLQISNWPISPQDLKVSQSTTVLLLQWERCTHNIIACWECWVQQNKKPYTRRAWLHETMLSGREGGGGGGGGSCAGQLLVAVLLSARREKRDCLHKTRAAHHGMAAIISAVTLFNVCPISFCKMAWGRCCW